MSRLRWRRGAAVALLVASVVLWAFPSDVAALIARKRPVLLGRYSVDSFSTLLAITIVGLLVALGLWFPSKLRGRQQVFRVVTAVVAVCVALVIGEVTLRLVTRPRYVEEQVINRANWPAERATGSLRRRPPNLHYRITYVDEPEHARSSPRRSPGYPTSPVNLTTDARGFRNAATLERADVIVLGDSFAEGSRVDDRQTWAALLEQKTGLAVYNLAVSGASPRSYLNALFDVGLTLQPSVAICMLYEGNDFEAGAQDVKQASSDLRRVVKNALLRKRLKELMVKIFGPLNADAPVPQADGVAWQPIGIPAGTDAKYYTFRPVRLLELCRHRDRFAASGAWRNTAAILDEMIDTCRQRDIRLIFVYAPSKAHVVLPLVRDRVTPEVLHAFASYRRHRGLPPPATFHQRCFDNLDAMESQVAEHLRDRGVTFLSTTVPLRQRMAAGVQVYFTYDKHWTPPGHQLVAKLIAPHLESNHTSGQQHVTPPAPTPKKARD